MTPFQKYLTSKDKKINDIQNNKFNSTFVSSKKNVKKSDLMR